MRDDPPTPAADLDADGQMLPDDSGLMAYAALLAMHRIAVDPAQLRHSLGHQRDIDADDLRRLAKREEGVKATGVVSYAVNSTGQASEGSAANGNTSDIQNAISLLNTVMQEYDTVAQGMAVRMALQGGLSQFAVGITYDATTDQYTSTTNQQLAPMLEAIFRAAPADNTNNAIDTYLSNWNQILWQIYPNYQISSGDTVTGAAMQLDQVFILQQVIEAYEAAGVNYDIRGIAHDLSVDQSKIITNTSASEIDGTSGTDFFYITPGDHTYNGQGGTDDFFVGQNVGNDTIIEYAMTDASELVFTSLNAGDVTATREGEDLLLTVNATGKVIRLKDEFLGELNPYAFNGNQQTSGVASIVFSDGTIWDRFQMSMEVSRPLVGSVALIGSGSADVLWAGAGHQYLSGGAGGDIYIVQPEAGQLDVTIDDQGTFSFGAAKAGLDFLMFKGGITQSNLRLTRQGNSDDLRIQLLDANGNLTGDQILIKGQFADVVFNLGLFASDVGSTSADDSLNYVAPNQIERFVFDDGREPAELRFEDGVVPELRHRVGQGGRCVAKERAASRLRRDRAPGRPPQERRATPSPWRGSAKGGDRWQGAVRRGEGRGERGVGVAKSHADAA